MCNQPTLPLVIDHSGIGCPVWRPRANPPKLAHPTYC